MVLYSYPCNGVLVATWLKVTMLIFCTLQTGCDTETDVYDPAFENLEFTASLCGEEIDCDFSRSLSRELGTFTQGLPTESELRERYPNCAVDDPVYYGVATGLFVEKRPFYLMPGLRARSGDALPNVVKDTADLKSASYVMSPYTMYLCSLIDSTDATISPDCPMPNCDAHLRFISACEDTSIRGDGVCRYRPPGGTGKFIEALRWIEKASVDPVQIP